LFLRLQVFIDTTLCQWASFSRPFDGTYRFRLQGVNSLRTLFKAAVCLAVSLGQATVCNTALVYLLHLNSDGSSSWTAWCLKMQAPFSVETSGNSHRKTQRRIPEDLNLFLAEIFYNRKNDVNFSVSRKVVRTY